MYRRSQLGAFGAQSSAVVNSDDKELIIGAF